MKRKIQPIQYMNPNSHLCKDFSEAFSAALFDNQSQVGFKHIYEAIRTTKAVYPDVIKKELVVFKEAFKDELALENVVIEI